ncbi:hypothetical protein A3G06_01720 [Candidatus Nomurabacteria bacterium RIFCSPLOWO2_12_FULL_46_14]|uniref:ATP-grasp domain-containing protein n=1 Tax=Candidatus Nomurabacteria bacterium RIFCSPLOWO2_12_FULL_46_14 TaxID=1801797 RepID=A0A1F6Y9F2_9BACT|nr:MAG: hypothetical protein A3G06_01720 [Candidatus Nomurabacteria bacterium RIFCSPLOWO2_12_FULL_46_14]
MTKLPYLTELVKKLAPKVGAKVFVEPEWGYAAQIIYPNGIVRSLRYFSLDLNHIGSADIAKDKSFAKFFIKQLGYPVVPGTTIFKKEWANIVGSKRTISYAPKYASKLGYPIIAKPNNKSQGVDVFLAHNSRELKKDLAKIFTDEKVALIEEYLPGRDYRIVVLDQDVISAYERLPLSVVGDGRSSVFKLLKNKQKIFVKKGRDTNINFKDVRIISSLKKEGYKLSSILPKGKQIFLLPNANLSTGGDSVDVTRRIHRGFKKIAVDITRHMGLRLSGVDVMVTEGDITKNPKDCSYYIIEINAAPGLDHYVTTGARQRQLVEAMYLKILKALAHTPN